MNIKLFIVAAILILSAHSHAETTNHVNTKIYCYLVNDVANAVEAKDVKLANLKLAEAPLFTSDDIVYYKAGHSFRLTDSAYKAMLNLYVPIQGTPFVVCVGNRRVYMGAFWTTVSSVPWEGIAIPKPWRNENSELEILRGTSKNDPRGDAELLEIMKSLGKLKEN